MDLEKLIEIRFDIIQGVESGDMNDIMWAINDLDTLIFKESHLLDLKKEILSDLDNYEATNEKPKREFKVGDTVMITGDGSCHDIPVETICRISSAHHYSSWCMDYMDRERFVLESDMEHSD